MNKLPPFKFFALQNFPFIEEDFDTIKNYQLLCKIVEYVKKVASTVNEEVEQINNLLNWFNNLDVQDEIDNKLDEMAEDGTLAEIINEQLFNELNEKVTHDNLILNDTCTIDFPYLGLNASDCSIIRNNNKVIVIDVSFSASPIITWCQNHNISHIDYIIISHYHNDHVGSENAVGFVALVNSDLVDENTVVYLPHKGIDWSQVIATEKSGIMNNENIIKSTLTNAGITYIEPNNLDKLVLSTICELTFMNIGATYYASYYGLTHNEYNNFSMVVELKHNNRYSLFTGDIVEQAQNNVAPLIHQIDILKAPHHDLEPNCNLPFMKKMTCTIMVFMENQNYAVSGLYSPLAQAIKTNAGNIYDTNNSQNIHIILKNDNIIQNSDYGVFTVQNVGILNASGIHLAENTDLDNLKLAGTYYTNTYQETLTLKNTPTAVMETEFGSEVAYGRCKVVNVFMNYSDEILIQMFITGIYSYYRIYNTTGGWGNWCTMYGDSLTSMSANYIAENTDLDNVLTIGKYVIKNGTVYNSLSNIPVSDMGGSILMVVPLRPFNDARKQILITATNRTFIRTASMNNDNTSVTSWSNWFELDMTEIE